VGTPTEIYDQPANTFVAGFIGNPAMNLVPGNIRGGVFVAEQVRVPGVNRPDGPATLGFRAEDARLADTGEIEAPVYTVENLGEAVMLTLRAGGALVAVKAAKDYRGTIGQQVAVAVPRAACHLFDAVTGDRITG
jgi:multiple sugar transport system ATP-binding protein